MEAIDWAAFAEAAPEIARAGHRLLRDNEVAFLASVTARGRPRLHPFVPRIVDGRLVAFIMDSSPKLKDLSPTGHYALHAWPGSEDEEFVIGGEARPCDHDASLREAVAEAMGFAIGVDTHHILFEFFIDQALWTRWLDFGTADQRPSRRLWHAGSQQES
jgi:hypothetical protein